MRISLSLTNVSFPDGTAALHDHLGAIAGAAEDAGLDTVWIADHLFQADPSSDPAEPALEAYTALGFLAARTSRIRLGTLVTGAIFRAPALLVKAVTTLDVLSGGRAWLGIGAGYNDAEARAMGIAMPSVPARFDLLADTVDLAERMWAGDDSPFEGRTTRLERPICSPRPISSPHPPVLIGGTGERRTLRLVAEKADACNLFDIPDGGAAVRRQLDVLGRHCADVGRPFEEIERTISTALHPGESAAEFVKRCQALADIGIQHVIVITRGRPFTTGDVEVLGTAAAPLAAV
jgi:F420-dependent oxidoreductase-like protein